MSATGIAGGVPNHNLLAKAAKAMNEELTKGGEIILKVLRKEKRFRINIDKDSDPTEDAHMTIGG